MLFMVIDDALYARELIVETLLSRYKDLTVANIVECSDGLEAMKMLLELRENDRFPDLIISDWNMPRMNGMEFIEMIKASGVFKKIPTIMISALSHKDKVIKALARGVHYYILKPVKPVELLIKVEAALKSKTTAKPEPLA
ncbi:response regulator [Candidatus Riflebacteria bacterium]